MPIMTQMIFQALFEHSSMGIIISSEDGTIEKTNPYASKIFGYDINELIGQKIEVLIPPHLREKHIVYRHRYNEKPVPRSMGSNLNLMATKKNGMNIPVEVSLSFFSTNGRRHIISFVNDITERKRVEDELKSLTAELESKVKERTKELRDALIELNHTNEGLSQEISLRKKAEQQIRQTLEREKELNELKSRLVSMASHEFRTPLSGILTSVSLIARYHKPEDEEKRDKHIQTIKKSVKNLTAILNDFLSLDRLDQGKIISTPTLFTLTDFIEELVGELKEISEKNQNIVVEHKNREITLIQDKDMLRNVFINLLSNAIKYSPIESTINITTNLKNSQVVILIQDQGIGIPLADQKHLFDRFFRAHNALNVQGTGLGLNIVKRYLDLMGGTIQYTSIENQGTTFEVTLPLGENR